ncbi:hypothetical protein FRC01_009247 [Tulasnella sp. 417]|nr:hypothetical protein FRC01_009247 [Tulasnella sp. 417]
MQLHAPAADAHMQRPGFLQMTSMPPVPSPRSTGSAEMSSSAPATTDFTSHPSHAILSELGQPIPHGLPLDRWNTVRNDTTDHDAAPRYTSAADLWNTGYTLAIQPGRSRMNSRHPSRMPTPTLTHWEDTTPTQSVLIPRSLRRQDDSLEVASASKRSDSGGSSRSATSSNRRRRSRSKRRNGSECPSDQHSVDSRSVTSHSRSSRGSIHGPSSYKHPIATSFEDSRRHFRTSRQSSHPLSSSFSAKDAEEELRKFQDTQKGKDQPATVSQSVPNDRGNWSRGSFNGKGKELPRVAESTTASVNASPEISKKALAPISTSSSSATIAALPTSISTRTVGTGATSTSSPPKTAASSIMSSTLSSSKRNSSRTTSHSQSKSHSRSHSTATVAEEEGGDKDAPLPRVKSNQSITSMTTSSSRRARHSSREPPSPSATVYSIAGPSAPRIPRGMSMTSLSGQGFGMQNRGSMYGNPVSPGGQSGHGGGAVLPRTASQPYMQRWASGSSAAGASAFGSPNGPTPPGTVNYGHYGLNHPHTSPYGPIVPPLQPLQPLQPLPPPLNRAKSREGPRAAGPMYPVLALPTERRKKIVKETVVDERGHEVEVDREEEEDVYTKPKRLFYFDR